MKKKLIVFDIDGTLTDSVHIHQTAFVDALKDIGVSSIDSNFKSYKHHTDSYIAKVIYENNTAKIFDDELLQEFERNLFNRIQGVDIQEINGALALTRYLENQTDVGVCYATGSLKQPAEYKLSSIGVEYAEQQLVTANKHEEREKIVSQAIQNAKEHYQVDRFEKIISVGDGVWDLKTARHLNLEFVGVGKQNEVVLREHGSIHHCTDLTEFASHFIN